MTGSKFPEGCCPQCGLPYGKHHPMCGYGRVEASPDVGEEARTLAVKRRLPQFGGGRS